MVHYELRRRPNVLVVVRDDVQTQLELVVANFLPTKQHFSDVIMIFRLVR